MFLSELVPDLLMEVPNLTDVQAMRYLQRSARRFYTESLLWEERRSYSVADGTFVVRFMLPVDECSIIAVKRGYFEGEELPVFLESEFVSAMELPAAPQPLGYLPRLSDKTAFVAPIASVRQDNSYDFTLILAPTMDPTSCRLMRILSSRMRIFLALFLLFIAAIFSSIRHWLM